MLADADVLQSLSIELLLLQSLANSSTKSTPFALLFNFAFESGMYGALFSKRQQEAWISNWFDCLEKQSALLIHVNHRVCASVDSEPKANPH